MTAGVESCRLQLLLLILWQLHRQRVLHSRGRGGGRLAGRGPAAHFLPFEIAENEEAGDDTEVSH